MSQPGRDKGAKGPIVVAKQRLQSVLVAILGEGDEDGLAGILAFGHLHLRDTKPRQVFEEGG